MGNTNGKPVVFTDQGTLLADCVNHPSAYLFQIAQSLSIVRKLLPGREHLLLTSSGAVVNLNHFRLLRVVGKGAFGKVRIVERKDTGLTFALKYIRKDEGQQ